MIMRALILVFFLSALTACPRRTADSKQQENEKQHIQAVSNEELQYEDVSDIFANSCMPCHNHEFLPQLIARLEKAEHVKELDGDSRERVLAELYGLKERMDNGEPISFVSEKQVMAFLKQNPGEMYLMLENGVMPAAFAEDLMQAVNWPKYTRLSPEDRVRLLIFAKPYSQDYLR